MAKIALYADDGRGIRGGMASGHVAKKAKNGVAASDHQSANDWRNRKQSENQKKSSGIGEMKADRRRLGISEKAMR